MERSSAKPAGTHGPVHISVVLTAILACCYFTEVTGQYGFDRGQNVVPAFEGWEQNLDGSFNMVFGFYNRNCEEVLHIPIGPENSVAPGGPDRGQPTRFLPRRGKFIFRVRVPPDFGSNELVWTLTANGKTERAYASLRPRYVIDTRLMIINEGQFGQQIGEGDNEYPVLRVEGDTRRSVTAGEPLRLTAFASDDGRPKPRKGQEGTGRTGLMVGWLVYRGDDTHVTFDPEQFNPDLRRRYTERSSCKKGQPTPEWAKKPLPADGKFMVAATFSKPGTYVLRAMAHDAGLKTTQKVTVTVTDR